MDRHLLDVCDRVFDAAAEAVLWDGLDATFGQGDGLLGGLLDARSLQGGDGHDLAVECLREGGEVHHVAVLLEDVHHVDGDEHGDAELDELRGEVEVALEVGAVDDVQDGVGTLVGKVVAGHDLLERVGGERIDAGQVRDGHVRMSLELAVLLLDRDAGPVAHVLVRAGEGIEQGRLSAVGVAREGDGYLSHALCLL